MKNESHDVEAVQAFSEAYGAIRDELSRSIVGQDQVLETLLMAMFCRGHCLLVGVPGLAKTLMIRSLAETLSLSFHRIQFTPDLMPSDITGTEVIQEDRTTGHRKLAFLPGPVFAQMILADEINRTPPKTQAALLEAMQEHQLTIGGQLHRLEEPFLVLATQNPIEQEGTYPLPEAQLDRFMFEILVDYPSEDEEMEIVRRTTGDLECKLTPMLDARRIIELQRTVRRIPVADYLTRLAVNLVRLSRPNRPETPDFVNELVRWGAGPRASQYLVLAAKARAVLCGRFHVEQSDLHAAAYPVLRHRILMNFHAEAEGIRSDELIGRLLEHVSIESERSS